MKNDGADKHDCNTYKYDNCNMSYRISLHTAVEKISLGPFLFLAEVGSVDTCRDRGMCRKESQCGYDTSLREVAYCHKPLSKFAPVRSADSDKSDVECDNHCGNTDRDTFLDKRVHILHAVADCKNRQHYDGPEFPVDSENEVEAGA